MKRYLILSLIILHASSVFSSTPSSRSADSDTAPFYVTDNLFDQSNTNTLGLTWAEGAETVTIFAPDESTDKFSNGVVMTSFRGSLYCMWQSSARDEDAADTWVAYSRSDDNGITWTAPMVLAESLANGYCTSGGWLATDDALVGFINTWPAGLTPKGGYTQYVISRDGVNWSAPADVKMQDGTTLNAVFEQDPHRVKGGRIVNAAHFQPGLKVCPIYTDDPLGISGWIKADFEYTANGDQSRELEPSLYQKPDGRIVMVFRDQNSTYYKLAAESCDNGETWTKAVLTNMPDARTKQSAGNLPDGTSFFAGNPVTNKTRIPLVLTLSTDGECFDTAYLLREGGSSMPQLRFAGSAKRLGYHYPKAMVDGDYLYVAYALNKEDVQFTRIPLSAISIRSNGVRDVEVCQPSVSLCGKILSVSCVDNISSIEIYSISGVQVYSMKVDGNSVTCDLSAMPDGLYMLRVGGGTQCNRTILLRD